MSYRKHIAKNLDSKPKLESFSRGSYKASTRSAGRTAKWQGGSLEANWCDASKSGMRIFNTRHHG